MLSKARKCALPPKSPDNPRSHSKYSIFVESNQIALHRMAISYLGDAMTLKFHVGNFHR
jgi:hypothetical protein